MNTIEIRELHDAELNVVGGEMDCQTAGIIANIFAMAATVLFVVNHDSQNGAYWIGRSEGVRGDCPK